MNTTSFQLLMINGQQKLRWHQVLFFFFEDNFFFVLRVPVCFFDFFRLSCLMSMWRVWFMHNDTYKCIFTYISKLPKFCYKLRSVTNSNLVKDTVLAAIVWRLSMDCTVTMLEKIWIIWHRLLTSIMGYLALFFLQRRLTVAFG